MSTRGKVVIDNGNAHPKYTGIYCGHDSYLSGLGKVLEENYTTEEKVRELINMGGASSIYPTLNESDFYHRDAGEDLDIEEYESDKELKEEGHDIFCEYMYLFRDGKWYVFDTKQDDFITLDEARKLWQED